MTTENDATEDEVQRRDKTSRPARRRRVPPVDAIARLTPLVIILLLFPNLAPCQQGLPQTIVLKAKSPSPLADIVDQIEHLYAQPVNFEEEPYQNSKDLKPTPVKQEDGSTIVLLSPPVAELDVTLGPTDTSAYNALQTALAAYHSAGLPGEYAVEDTGGRLSVVPRYVTDAGGTPVAITPLMATPARFPLADRLVVDTLQIVAAAVAAQRDAKVILLDTPFHVTDTISFSANGEPARDVIASIGEVFHVALSSQWLYDATTKTYYMTVQSIFRPNPAGGPPQPGPPIIRARPRQTNGTQSPFYTHP